MRKRIYAFIIAMAIVSSVAVLPVLAADSVIITSNNAGNIFSDDESIEFFIEISGDVSNTKTEFKVNNDSGELIWNITENAVNSKKIIIPVDKNGGYSLSVKLINQSGETISEETTVFSRVMSGEQNNAFQLQGHFDAYQYTLKEQMGLIDKANAGGYRDHPVGWLEYAHNNDSCDGIEYLNSINTESAKYNFSSNISIPHLGCVQYTGGKDIPPTGDTALLEFGKYCVGLLRATGAKRAEIWNEPNMNELITPKVYVDIVKAGASALKDFDETIDVGAVSLANPNGMCLRGEIFGVERCNDTSFDHYKKYGKCYFNDLIEEGLLDQKIDAITLHSYYKDVFKMPEEIKYYRDLLDGLGHEDIKIWITEYGWYTGDEASAVTELEQANIMVKEYVQVMAAGYADSMSVYNLTNKYDLSAQPPTRDSENPEHNFGIVQSQLDELSETGVALSAKKSYIALAAMNSLLSEATGKGEVHFFGDENEIAACDFIHKDGEDITAIFGDSPCPIVIECESPDLKVYDFYGNEHVFYSENGRFGINLDGNVTYVKGNIGSYTIETNKSIALIKDNYAEITTLNPAEGVVIIGQYVNDRLEKADISEIAVSANSPYKVYFEKAPWKYENISSEIIKHSTPDYESGDGSIEKPYIIDTYYDLAEFRKKVNAGEYSACAVLTANIYLENDLWVPIGTSENKYSGIFDGNGYEISGLNGKGSQWGFFGHTNGGSIKNLTLKAGNNGALSLGHQSAMFVAMASGNTIITNCAGYGNLESSGYIGGITCQGNCIVEDSFFVGDIHGLSWVSGMGYNAKAENCFAYGNITADINAFKISNGSAVNCYYLTSVGDKGTGGYGIQKAADAFSNGEIAYQLGNSFGQKLNVDLYPQFLNDDNKVIKREINKIKAFFWKDLSTLTPLAESL